MRAAIALAERGLVPDRLLRRGIHRFVEARHDEICAVDAAEAEAAILERMRGEPLAAATDAANEQHYEVPTGFFRLVLGRHLKYSCGYWPDGVDTLDGSEAAALDLVCQRAGLEDGMEVLDLGCGWGSLTLWIAAHYPNCRVLAVSNSRSQGEWIREAARRRGHSGVEARTADLNGFQPGRRFDRVLSIEMFEHMWNQALLMGRVAQWLKPDGRLFVHHFCHRSRPYFFEDRGSGDWIARHFFTGGLMPSETLLDALAGPLKLEARWRVGGDHYERTALAWLRNLDRRRAAARAALAAPGGGSGAVALRRWRIFFLACAGTFGYDEGREWFVSHSLWSRRAAPGPPKEASS